MSTHEENGYEVETLQSGQVRRYGPSIHKYRVVDLRNRPEAEVREYCTTHVRRADDPQKHSLVTHLQGFRNMGDGTYIYQAGHEYTG